MSAEIYPDWQQADLEVTPVWATEVVSYESGYTQRRPLRSRVAYRFDLSYPQLSDADYRTLRNFYDRHMGAWDGFWFQDFTEVDFTTQVRSVAGKQFGIGDGITYEFKLPHDRMDAATIYIDGAAVAPALMLLDLALGIVMFDTAPATGEILTYDATNPYYRVRFAEDSPKTTSHKWMFWAVEVKLDQVVEVVL